MSTTLVLGATGRTGLRAAARSGPTPFDRSDSTGWHAALYGTDAVRVVLPSVPGPVHEFVARAEAVDVRHLVLLSGRGADTRGDSTFGLDVRSAEAAEMFVPMERGALAATTDDVATVLGRPPRTFEDYVARAAAAGARER